MQTDLTQELSENEIPLFPLHVVLFPGGILPLHIFEQRYRQMIQFCLEHERPFGVVLIKEGREVGEHAEPYLVGTAVKIIEANRLEDGRMNIITAGQYRFEIVRIRQDLPYLVAEVKTLKTGESETPVNLEMLAVRANQLYRTYETTLAKLIPEWKPAEKIPSNPHRLSYQIGSRLQLPLIDKQHLLEILPIDQLLNQEIVMLEQENQRLKASLIAQSAFSEGRSADESPWDKASLN